MTTIQNLSITQTQITSTTQKSTKQSTKQEVKSSDEEVIYDTSSQIDTSTYTVDYEKVKKMKEETDQKMLELFKQTINDSVLKQVGGLRGVLEHVLKGESTESDIEIEITEETINQAKEDISEGGYWSPEETSDRFIEFAKALSGGNPEKAELLKNAFIDGYKKAEEIWGGNLPDISQETYDLTIEKLEKWVD